MSNREKIADDIWDSLMAVEKGKLTFSGAHTVIMRLIEPKLPGGLLPGDNDKNIKFWRDEFFGQMKGATKTEER